MKNRLTTGLFTNSIVRSAMVIIAFGAMCTGVVPILSGRLLVAQEMRSTQISSAFPDGTSMESISRESLSVPNRPIVSAPVSPSHFPTTGQVIIPPISAPSTTGQYASPVAQTAPTTKNESFRFFGGTLLGERAGKSGSKPSGWSFTRRRQSGSSRPESNEYDSERKRELNNRRKELPLTFEGILDEPIYSQTSDLQVDSEANDSFESFTVILPDGQEGEFLSDGSDVEFAESAVLEPQMSPWGAFQAGSWCRMKTTSVSFEVGAGMRTVAETKLTLVGIDTDGYLLQKETSIKMGNVAHNRPTEIVKYDFLGVPITPDQTLELAPTSLSIARKIIPCQLRQIDRISPLRQETSLLWYSSVVAPYLLQKETRIYDLQREGKRLLSTSITTLSKSAANVLLGGNTLGWQSVTVVQKEESTATTITIHSNRVPGSILRETTTETDATGRILFSSTTTLLDYFNARW